ncbi:MAG TPA: transcription termination factor NusA [Phycisphaerae bacterium]|nr:transcription termination factor NusA [Phycisphaerae bacterium]
MSQELLRLVESISRDKNIEKELVLQDLEAAMVSAVRKAYAEAEDVKVDIDRMTGEIGALLDGQAVDMKELGRIAAQTAKQVMIQKLREAERGSIFEEFIQRKGTIVTGTVSRFEGGALVVSIGRAEGFLPRSEQIPGEMHHPGERIRALVLDVREAPHQVRIILSRSHPDLIRRLFELEVPEVAERIIEIKALAREAGYRTKAAVSSIDMKVDAVGACVGVRGSRIKNIVEELGGEKIDIVRWNESSQILIGNALKPAEVQEIALCFELGRATVVVAEDQLSLAIGKRGQNVRLAARLTGWDVDILTPAEYNKGLDDLEKTLRQIDGVEDVMIDKMVAMGMVSLMDVEEVGIEPMQKELGMSEELAANTVAIAAEHAKRIAAEMRAAREQAERERTERQSAEKQATETALAALRGELSEQQQPDQPPTDAEAPDQDAAAVDQAETDIGQQQDQDDATRVGVTPEEQPEKEPSEAD